MCNHNNKQEMARHELQEVFPSKTKRSRKENHNPLWRVLLSREHSLDGSLPLPLSFSRDGCSAKDDVPRNNPGKDILPRKS
jgi:hypothetical protein